jgi:transcriptional regulator with XRE-family HTH domain
VAFETVQELIRAARNGRSQKEFADLLKVEQSMVSKYERGKASPPISVINRCMRLVHAAEGETAPSAEQLADRVRESLADPKLAQMRSALLRLMDAFASENAPPFPATCARQKQGGREDRICRGAANQSRNRLGRSIVRSRYSTGWLGQGFELGREGRRLFEGACDRHRSASRVR